MERAVDLNKIVETIRTRDDLASFVFKLLDDFKQHPDRWDNKILPQYLNGIAMWTHDMDGYFSNLGRPAPPQLTWKLVGEILLAARTYDND